jgi:hypothetical protein
LLLWRDSIASVKLRFGSRIPVIGIAAETLNYGMPRPVSIRKDWPMRLCAASMR